MSDDEFSAAEVVGICIAAVIFWGSILYAIYG